MKQPNKIAYAKYKECISKNTYYTTKDANKAIEHGKRYGYKQRYYKCDFCKRYHLTKQSEEE